ncbi:MAG TPA: Nif3-like dinuclear metal center hexameric protein [Puia sp.]|nr:Nif3-like dinuclear metal center hexameric protein [Puia sp.]
MSINSWPRRKFLATSLAALAGTSIRPPHALATSSIPLPRASGSTTVAPPPTIAQVIDALLADIPGAPFPNTVDTIKSGDPNQPVKGIVTTMFATDAIIQKTIDLGANFIIAHEPTFYNHTDETDWLGADPVLRFKKNLLEKHGIVVWRFHDGIHAHNPDGIRMGVLQALGWDGYYDPSNPPLTILPSPTPLANLIDLLKKKLATGPLKYIGDLAQPCTRIVLSPGAAGGRKQIGWIQQFQPDTFVCGELNEWETSEYIRDARYQGKKISLVVLGHSVSEEPGMEWLVPVLKKKIPGVPVTHLPSGDAFTISG